jgi:hypothetical protein
MSRVSVWASTFVVAIVATAVAIYEWRAHRSHIVVYHVTAAGCGPMTVHYYAAASKTGSVASFLDESAQGSWRSAELRFVRGDHLHVDAQIDAQASFCSVSCEITVDGASAVDNHLFINAASCTTVLD